MRYALIVLAGMLAVGGCKSMQKEPKEEEIEMTLDQVPPAVREAITRESGGTPVGKIERERETGRTVYEIEMTKDGKRTEVEFDESGRVLKRETGADDKED